ncbi:hypothetical protein SKAU_G00323700 [Synaphobranchus kaupii]|uniref:Uncharacterized protein n=1 Tax=Synaphobranchus kaupii TaxID=118154 RepID=A0A9Q1EPC3_SYNKA|nr:hypothetical protein SKAU_G00323700 [Synaphobranchus kaupii]
MRFIITWGTPSSQFRVCFSAKREEAETLNFQRVSMRVPSTLRSRATGAACGGTVWGRSQAANRACAENKAKPGAPSPEGKFRTRSDHGDPSIPWALSTKYQALRRARLSVRR